MKPAPHVLSSCPAALVIGLCSHGLSVARSLASSGIATYAVEKDFTIPGVGTNSVIDVFRISSFTAKDLIDGLVDLRKKLGNHDRVVLFPINDSHVTSVGENWERLAGLYELSWGSCRNEILKLQKKSELESVCRARGLNYPKSTVIETTDEVATLTDGFNYPVIIKPVRPMSSFKTIKAFRLDELISKVSAHAHDLPILCQEFISGTDEAIFFAELIQDKGKTVSILTGRKKLSWPPAMGQSIIAHTYENPEVSRLAEQFFSGSSLSGPLALELKRDESNQYWVIEPTVGRTEFLVELCMCAGQNLPLLEFQLTLGLIPVKNDRFRSAAWFDTEKSPLAYLRAAVQERSLRPYHATPSFAYFNWTDPVPALRGMSYVVRQLLRRLFGQSKSRKT